MTFNIYVRFSNDASEYALWPIMQDPRTKEIYGGALTECWPTAFTERNLGAAIRRTYAQFRNISTLKVEPSRDWFEVNRQDERPNGQASSPGYSEACGVHN